MGTTTSLASLLEPNVEFVEDARDRVAYPTTGVPETTEEMKHILALGEHANIYIKDYTITVDHESHTATIEFEEVVEGNPLMNEDEDRHGYDHCKPSFRCR